MMMRIPAIIALGILVFSISPAFAATAIDTEPDPSIDVSPPWQYTTAQVSYSAYDPSVDVRSADKWDDDVQQNPIYFINHTQDTLNGPDPQISDDAAYITYIQAGANKWITELSAETQFLPGLTYGGPTTEKPSQFYDLAICGAASGSIPYDGVNEVGFCDLSSGGQVRLHPSHRATPGVSDTIDEFDMVFNEDRAWVKPTSADDPFEIQDTATHEFGHVFGLGDLYNFYPTSIDPCVAFPAEKEDPKPVMCKSSSTLQIADKNGIRQMYAKDIFNDLTQTSTSWTVDGSDIAIANVNTTSSTNEPYDMIQVFAEHNSTNSNIRAEFEWDLDATGNGGNGTVANLISGITGRVREVGAAFDNIDGDGFPDLIVVYTVESPANTYKTYYKIFSDIKRSSTTSSSTFTFGSTFGGTLGTQITSAAGSRGIDVLVWDYNNDNTKDILVVTTKIDTNGDYRMYYYYTTITNAFALGSWTAGADGGDYKVLSYPIGATLYDKSKRLLAVNYHYGLDPDVDVFHFAGTSLSTIDYTRDKFTPLRELGFSDSAGSAESVNISGVSGQNFADIVYAYENDDNMYWLIEWDSRLNSHP